MYVVCINEPRGRNTTMQTLVQVNPFLKTWIPSVAPRRVLCTVWTSTGSGLCKTDFTGCLWAPGPMSIYSKLKCRSKMHSAWLVERGHGVPHPALCPSSFFSLEGNWDVEKHAAVSSSWSGWLWHTQICCRLGCSWLNGTQVPTACHSPEPNPSKKAKRERGWAFNPVRLTIAGVSGSLCGRDPVSSLYITLSDEEVVHDLQCAFSSSRKRTDSQWLSTYWFCPSTQREEIPDKQL